MELKQLRYFLAIAEERQITAAAKRLHIAQPPLSYQLRQMEEELGVILVKRGPRSITLTDAGELLRKKAEQILSLSDSVKNEVSNYGKGLCGTLSIGTISSSGGLIPDERILRFSRQYPNVRFEIYEGNTYSVLEMLEKGIVEFGIVRTPFPHKMLEYRYASKDPMAAVMTAQNAIGAQKDRISLRELENAPLIFYRRFELLIGEAFTKAGVEPQIFCRNDDARTTVQWARKGLGVGLVPKSALDIFDLENVTVKDVDCPELVTKMAVIWMKNRYLSALGEKFVECFAKAGTTRD